MNGIVGKKNQGIQAGIYMVILMGAWIKGMKLRFTYFCCRFTI